MYAISNNKQKKFFFGNWLFFFVKFNWSLDELNLINIKKY